MACPPVSRHVSALPPAVARGRRRVGAGGAPDRERHPGGGRGLRAPRRRRRQARAGPSRPDPRRPPRVRRGLVGDRRVLARADPRAGRRHPSRPRPRRGGSSVIAFITYNAVPAHNPTFKYERLGPLAVDNHRRYCERHGYRFISDVPVAADRPACWAKLPAMLDALEHHRWVLWADSDALIFEPSRRLEDLCDPAFDLIATSHDEFFRLRGIPRAEGLARMPINTGVFLLQATPWSRDF